MTRGLIYDPLRWDHAKVWGASVPVDRVGLLPRFARTALALITAFIGGWVFAMFQQAHWIVTHTQ